MRGLLASSGILITGPPRSGKTSLVIEATSLAKSLGLRVIGFFAPEVREGSSRIGFNIETVSGDAVPLARKSPAQPWGIRFGSYYVNPGAKVVFEELRRALEAGCDLLVIDEIGPMELLVPGARELFREVLSRRNLNLLGVIHRRLSSYDRELYKLALAYKIYDTALHPRELVASELSSWIRSLAFAGTR
ncbi:MAG: nucleoside-triphosphatase [Fervidicoccaceae archaeon]